MRKWKTNLPFWLAWSGLVVSANAAVNPGTDAAIQAIQQAPDPSAAVAAYANGFALDRSNAKLDEAYVSRMVDLGLPEMAYHQAQTLTTRQANNGLAWGVVAYVDARRAQMPEALAAINLAGPLAPESKFVQHTAGELVAWYDLKADKTTIPDNIKDGLAKLRSLLDNRPAFTEAYATAQKAYQGEASATSQPAPADSGQVVPNAPQAPMAPVAPQGYQAIPPGDAASAPAPVYYEGAPDVNYPDYSGAYLDWGPEYGYDWGPGWIAPAPWWWWQPCGFWGGCNFFPFVGVSFVFGDFDDFHHFHHDGSFEHGRFGHDGAFGHGHGLGSWHNGVQGRHDFFGAPARPSASITHAARANAQARFASAPSTTRAGTSTRWWSGAGQHSSLPTVSREPAQSSGVVGSHGNAAGAGASAPVSGRPSAPAQPSVISQFPNHAPHAAPSWAGHSSGYRSPPVTGGGWAGQNYSAHSYAVPRSSWAAPTYRAPAYAAPHFATPGGSFGGFRGGASSPGGSFHGGGSGGGGHR